MARTNSTLELITNGDLEQKVEVYTSEEFDELSRGINTTVGALKNAIAAEATRFEKDLATAKAIQSSAMPRTFPPFPEVSAFDIYASMNPAREVGGDFYDFFLIDDHTLGFFIADVSGKGIPASLFMMAAKTELEGAITSGVALENAIRQANTHLCIGNDAGMFVTLWAATLDYDTGLLTYVNAGHNPPLLRRDGRWTWLREKSGLFLGTFETAKYRSYTLQLKRGDELMLYTDGVTEAMDPDERLYGEDRLEAFLMEHYNWIPRRQVRELRSDLLRWANGAEQSDDITMLALEYGREPEQRLSLTLPARLENLSRVLDIADPELDRLDAPVRVRHALAISIEEIFVNVCNYAYPEATEDNPGEVRVSYLFSNDPKSVSFEIADDGLPFDPLEHRDPTAPRTIDETPIGGLGIMMTKRFATAVSYARDGNSNIFEFRLEW